MTTDVSTADASRERGTFWPIFLVLIGTVNIAEFFYKASFQAGDLLQGLGFLLMAPLLYFAPPSLSNPFKPNPHKPQVSPVFRALGTAGIVLVLAGLAAEWL